MSRVLPKFSIVEGAFSFLKLESSHKLHLDCKDKVGKDSQNLQEFIDKRALKNQDAHLGTTYIINYKKKPIGYITVATSNIHKNRIFKKARPSTRDGSLYPALIFLISVLIKSIEVILLENMYCYGVMDWHGIFQKKWDADTLYCLPKIPDAIRFYERHNYQIDETSDKEKFKLMYFDVFPELKK